MTSTFYDASTSSNPEAQKKRSPQRWTQFHFSLRVLVSRNSFALQKPRSIASVGNRIGWRFHDARAIGSINWISNFPARFICVGSAK